MSLAAIRDLVLAYRANFVRVQDVDHFNLGVRDHWEDKYAEFEAAIAGGPKVRGDCEDFAQSCEHAVWNRELLPANRISLHLVRADTHGDPSIKEDHAIAVFDIGEMWVADSLKNMPGFYRFAECPYRLQRHSFYHEPMKWYRTLRHD